MDAAKRRERKQGQAQTQNERKKTGRGYTDRLLRQLRFYYRCFLIHFLLSVMTTAVLFCFGFGLSALAAEGGIPRMLTTAVFAPTDGMPPYTRFSLPETALAAAVYLPGNTPTVYYVPDTAGHLHDSGEPLSVYEGESGEAVPDTPIAGREHVTGTAPAGASLYAHPGKAAPGYLSVVPCDLSASSRFNTQNGGILFSNQSGYACDAAALLSAAYPIAAPLLPVSAGEETTSGKPLVLIVHTHGTESYAPDGAVSVPDDFHARTEDTGRNVVAVGAKLAETLREQGIAVLHCETMFDRDSYADSYENAARYIKETVAQYPSIQYVFDVHRDALTGADGGILRPVTEIAGEAVAQIMSVVGTDAAGAQHAGWKRNNLTVAVHLQKRLNDAYPAFARPINLRAATFNAQYAPGSLLLEIGSSGNSMEEARAAAYYLGLELGALILAGDSLPLTSE